MPFRTRDPLLGATFDGWSLQKHLGRGNMGQVYVAVREDGTRAALKVLHTSLARDEEMLERFARELENTSRIQHPNVVRSLGTGRTPQGYPYLALELLEGRTLDERIEDEAPLSTAETVAIGVQIADGLAAAHAASVVHRDLKPENVMELPDGTIKLFDFGLAKAEVPDQPSMTAQEMRLGTPLFMAPEYIEHRSLDHRSDLYALGMTLFELATGQAPFEGPPFKILHLQVTQDAPTAASLHPGVDPALSALIARLIHRDPEERPQAAEEVAVALRQL